MNCSSPITAISLIMTVSNCIPIYKKTKNIYLVWIGEVIGTGFFGAMSSYPLMKMFYGLDAQSPFYYIPFYTPSAIVGAAMGVVVVLILKKTGVLNRMQNELS